MVSPADFLEKVKEYLNVIVDNEMIEEVKKISELHEKSEIEKKFRDLQIEKYTLLGLDNYEKRRTELILYYDQKADDFLHALEKFRYKLSLLEKSSEESFDIEKKIESLGEKLMLCLSYVEELKNNYIYNDYGYNYIDDYFL